MADGGLSRQFLYETFDLAASMATGTQPKAWAPRYGGLIVGHPLWPSMWFLDLLGQT